MAITMPTLEASPHPQGLASRKVDFGDGGDGDVVQRLRDGGEKRGVGRPRVQYCTCRTLFRWSSFRS